ncbi:MAG: hypothetical protein ACR2M3_20160 [Thermomicrobiales bacterium]
MVRELTKNETKTLIERHIEPHPDPVKEGDAWYRLKERGVPVYAIIGSMTPTFDNADDVADAFAVSREAMDAAIAYYQQHTEAIDARLAA